MLALLLIAALAADSPDVPAGPEDPRHYEQLTAIAVSSGDMEAARVHARAALDHSEFVKYIKFRSGLIEALIDERVGDYDAAHLKYQAAIVDDPLRAVQALRMLSEHPERDALVDEAEAHVRALAASAERGDKAVIYHTKKGAERTLTRFTTAQVLEKARRGEKVQYCWVPELDLTGQDLGGIDRIRLDRCLVGTVQASGIQLNKLWLRGLVLDTFNLGKIWSGDKNSSAVLTQASTIGDLFLKDLVFFGPANLSGVVVTERAYFPLSVFEGPVDISGADIRGIAEFRFASFGAEANFRMMRIGGTGYFAHAHFRDALTFSGVRAKGPLYFSSTRFDGETRFDSCEWLDQVTFEDAEFADDVQFASTRIPNKRLNLSRAHFARSVELEEVTLGGLDAFGTHFAGPARFTDVTVHGRTRFSVDTVTRATFAEDTHGLRVLYRDYQGDEDAEQPLTVENSYGVRGPEDLTARFEDDVSFSNTAFKAYTVFEGVSFGTPQHPITASFFNAQFLGETHFERTTWSGVADFRTLFGKELAFNEARFLGTFVLDDAYVDGRLTLTDATFADDATWSFYGAAIQNFQIDPSHVDDPKGGHRLFYEKCALGQAKDDGIRLQNIPAEQREQVCYDRLLDELVGLKEAYGAEAMIAEEDNAYWWLKHHETMKQLRYGSWFEKASAVFVGLGLFELCFGWGVELGNLGIAVLVITALFAILYRLFCPHTMLSYDGEEIPVHEVSFVGLFFISLQTLIAINTGWDFGDDDHRFRYLNTLETLIGYIILTFFVGAYTRMILA